MGNICRSPSAQGVFEKLVTEQDIQDQYQIDSAATHSYHVGHLPDSRAIDCASKRGIDLSSQRARKIKSRDMAEYDYVVAMDNDNYNNLMTICEGKYKGKVYKIIDFIKHSEYSEIPDPYYGGAGGFDLVLDLLEASCQKLLAQISSAKI